MCLRLFVGCALVALLVASACTMGAPAVPTAVVSAPVSIKVTTAPGSPNDQPVWVAVDTGIMQRNGLEVEFVNAPATQGIAALMSGQTDMAATGGAEALGAIAGGADLVIVTNLVPVIPWQFYAGPDVLVPTDLRGKKIGITTAGASYDTALRIVLPKFGLNPDTDVTLITTGSIPNVTSALLAGAIDAAPLVVTPASFKVVQQGGFHQVWDFATEAGPYPGAVMAVRREYVNQHRDIVQKYVDSIVQGVARFKSDRVAAIQTAKNHLDETDEALVTRTYEYFLNSVTPSQPFPKPEQFTEVLAALAARNESAKSIDLTRVLDPSFVQSAVDRGLDKTPN